MDFSDRKRIRLLICLALALATVGVYWRVGGFDFVTFDDPEYIIGNRMVRGGLSFEGILWAFTHSYASNWHPLTWISHMVDCQVFGLHAGGPHLVNLALHTANGVLLFVLLDRLTGAQWRSAIVAALFALHPLHVESVAWISERKDVLSTFFGLWSLLAYERGARSKDRGAGSERAARRSLRLALLLFALGLLAKPMLVTLPFVMLLLDFWPLQRVENAGLKTFFTPQFRKLALEKWPWFALAAASSVVTLYVQKTSGAIVGAGDLPVFWRVEHAVQSYVAYLEKAFWPANLAVFYPLDANRHVLPFVIASLCLLAISLTALATMKRLPSLLMGWLWFLGTLVPVIGLVQVGAQAMADRYSYVPLIGIFIAVVWAAHKLLQRSKTRLAVGGLAASISLILFAGATVSQVRYWQNGVTLFSRAVAVTPLNERALTDLGLALEEAGRNADALLAYQAAVQISPDSAEVHKFLGRALSKLGRDDEAVFHYHEAMRLNPKDADVQIFYGDLLTAAGKNQEALAYYTAAVRLKPASAYCQYNLGEALARQGMVDAAIDRYREAIRLLPDYADAYNNLGAALTTRKQLDEAVSVLKRALAIDPRHAEAHNNLGRALALQGKPLNAAAQYGEALRLNPNQPVFHYNLGLALLKLGRRAEATDHLSESVRLNPKSAEAHYELGRCLADSGQPERGIIELREAAQLRPDWAEPFNALAWILAMDDHAQVRDSAEAIRLAERAAALTAREQPGILNTLAAAYAEAGRFDEATNVATQALELARKSGRTNLVAQMQFALDRYQQHRPLRQN
jgi:tetratricopeptide (TPR) repeat protein